jgi:multiple sugar transport system permease protein
MVVSPVHGADGGPVTLHLWGGNWGIPPKDATDAWQRAQRAVFERFQQLHPNVRIVSANGIEVQGPASESGFLMAMAGGTAPDVFYVNLRKLDSYISQNFLYPLNEYVAKDPEVMQRVHPIIRDIVTVNGKTYCIPWFQCVMALNYRKDLFKEAGLDPDKPPRTWDEFYDDCKRLTIPEKGQWGFGFAATPQGTPYHWIDFLWQAGGDVVRQEPNGQWRAVFNSPQGVTALKFYRKLVADPWTRASDGQVFHGVAARSMSYPQDIADGKFGMWFAYSTDIAASKSDVNPSLIGMAALPAGPAGRANEINAGMWGMNSQIKDKPVRDAAWEYIKFMGSEEAERIRTKAYVEAGLSKLVNPDKLQKYGYTEYLRGVPKSWMDANTEGFKHGHPEPHGKNCDMIYTEMDYPFQAIALNPRLDPKKLLDDCAGKINTKLLGFTPPGEMDHKRRIGWIVFAFVLVGLGSMTAIQITRLARAHAEDSGVNTVGEGHRALPHGRPNRAEGGHSGPPLPTTPTPSRTHTFQYHLVPWLFMAPAVLTILVWAYYPLLRGMVMAFQDYRILGGSHFVGLDNFIEAVGRDTFWIAILNSLIYAVMSLALGFFVPIILALMLNEVPRGKMFFRTVYYLPAVTSVLVIMFLWKWFYDPSPRGLFNTLIAFYNQAAISFSHLIPAVSHWVIPSQTWLQNPKLAMLCVILPGIWAGAGPGSIIYLAAMKSIPEDMYEAADLDGASVWRKVWSITLPTLKPLIIINFVGAFIGSFKAMENIFIMTGGGPLNATHTIGLEIWYNAFMYLKFGYATAAAWIMGSMLIGFTMYQLKILRNVRFSAGGQG